MEVWGAHFTSGSSVFSVMAGWIAEILFFAYMCNRLNIAEYEVYWLMGLFH